ncbi:unnamed protein product [Linum trigynum]|uniref:Uncharacterized protein n=1 Tax=Linum trigynum TaxID=586398 RepID=A0AAV2DX47_9ROSI
MSQSLYDASTNPEATWLFHLDDNPDVVIIKEEEVELSAKEIHQQMEQKNKVIADMQRKMSQMIALMSASVSVARAMQRQDPVPTKDPEAEATPPPVRAARVARRDLDYL